MLELLMALDHAKEKELETLKVMDMMEVTNIATPNTNLISFLRANSKMIILKAQFVRLEVEAPLVRRLLVIGGGLSLAVVDLSMYSQYVI
jgi:hypothetical protein